MQIRKNTKPFKTIVNILAACQNRADRKNLVRLFITKAGQTADDRIAIEGIQTNADLFYEMTYQALLTNLQSPGHQLWESDDTPGLYFLRGSNKAWDETPFEFAEAIATEFVALGEPPNVRKKEAIRKYALPTPKDVPDKTPAGKKKQTEVKAETKVVKMTVSTPRQPSFNLKHPIAFRGLDRLVYKQKNLNKREVLNYYHKIADYLLPWLRDRMLWVRPQSDTPTELLPLNKDLWSAEEPIPDWIQQQTISKGNDFMLGNDKDHLFFYLEKGYIEFSAAHSRLKSAATPDYLVVTLDAPDFYKTVDTTLALREVLDGLQAPSFIKTDGQAGFHVYVPLDAKSKFEKCREVAAYLCKLVRLKIPDLATLNTAGELTYGKVSLNYSLNAGDQSITTPYSLVSGSLPTVATPLEWDEVQHGLRLEEFNIESIIKRLDRAGDPFEEFFKKKTNADRLLERLEDNYAFLL